MMAERQDAGLAAWTEGWIPALKGTIPERTSCQETHEEALLVIPSATWILRVQMSARSEGMCWDQPPVPPGSLLRYDRFMLIRFARREDVPALLEIYNQSIDSPVTFETVLPSEDEFASRLEAFSTTYPYLVSVEDGRITGYAYAHRCFEREAYRFDAEVTIYMDRSVWRTGSAGKLYSKLLELLEKMNIVNAYALVTEPNKQSVFFHQKMGFDKFAVFTDAGYKNGSWIDVIWLVNVLNDKMMPPPEPLSVWDVVTQEAEWEVT